MPFIAHCSGSLKKSTIPEIFDWTSSIFKMEASPLFDIHHLNITLQNRVQTKQNISLLPSKTSVSNLFDSIPEVFFKGTNIINIGLPH